MEEEKKTRRYDFRQKQIQKKANNILDRTITQISEHLPDLYWSTRSEEDQEDFGLDMKCELFDKTTRNSIIIFQLQNKGVSTGVKSLLKTPNKGLISYQIKLTKAKYYLYQINVPLVVIVCDTEKEIVYWHAIQLDEAIEDRIRNAEKEDKLSVQIYIDCANKLDPTTANRFINDVKNSLDEQIPRYNRNFEHGIFTTFQGIEINKNANLLDQTKEAIQKYLEEFSFIPPKEFLKLYPFRKFPNSYSFYDCFEGVIDNDELINLIEKIINPDYINDPDILGINDYKEKANFIIGGMRQLGIDYLRLRKSGKRIHISSNQNENICDCCLCRYNKFDFIGAFESARIISEEESLDQRLKKGYVHYKLGHFITAYEIFRTISDKAKQESKWVTYFISLFNIVQLKFFIQNYNWDHPDLEKILFKIDKISLQDEFFKIQNKKVFGVDLIKWIYELRFFYSSYQTISSLAMNIEEDYHGYVKGGWSKNNNTCQLVNKLFQISSLTNLNFLVFDEHPDFYDLIEFVTTGMIHSQGIGAIKKGNNGVLNDYMMIHFFRYGNPNLILTYFKRISLKKISYKSNKQDRSLFTTLMLNVIKSLADLNNNKNESQVRNFYFNKHLPTIFTNGLLLASIIEIPSAEIELLGSEIVDNQAVQKMVPKISIDYLKYFIAERAELLSEQTMRKLLTLSISDPVFHESSFIDVLTDRIRSHFPKILFSYDEVLEIEKIYSEKCPVCNYSHNKESLIYYYFITNEAGKTVIRKNIEAQLQKSFQADLYYTAIMLDVVLDKTYLSELINLARSQSNQKTFKNVFTDENDDFLRTFDMLVNIGFKLNLNFNSAEFAWIREKVYYRWLLDVDSFDYKLFDPMWLLNNQTAIYFERLKSVPQIKKSLREFLLENNNPSLAKIFLEYFV